MQNLGADAPNYHLLTARFSSSGQWDRALDTAREWLSHEPKNRHAHLSAGQALVCLKRYPEAEPHLAQVLAGNPGNDTAHRMMSLVHFHQNRFKAADESIQRALSLNPQNARHWYHLGWMFYKHGELASARKYVGKALELSPRDPDTLNLMALCEAKDPASAARAFQQYHDALEIDPENPQVHNNIGVYHMNVEKDYAKAEECFRRALFFDPSLKVARSNLFIALKHRDVIYRVLCAPRDFCYRISGFMRAQRRRSLLVYLLIFPLWMFAFRFVIGGLLLWFLFFWPMVKVYEFLTIGDLQTSAGEIGAKRGGFLNYRRWPLKLRLSLFGLLLLSFWGGVIAIGVNGNVLGDDNRRQAFFAAILFGGLVLLLVFAVRARWKRGGFRFRWRSRSREFDSLLDRQPVKKAESKRAYE